MIRPHSRIAALALALASAGCGASEPWNEPPPPNWPYLPELERRHAAGDPAGVVGWSREHGHKRAVERERILFLVGESHHALGQHYRACERYIVILEEFPYPAESETIGRRLYEAALSVRAEGKSRLRLPNTHRTIPLYELLEDSLRASPYGSVSDAARALLADAFAEAGRHEDAARVNEEIYWSQPHSAQAESALWKAAESHRLLYRGCDYDPRPILNLEEAGLEYVLRYPGGPHRARIDALLQEAKGLRIERLERERRFYRVQRNEKAVRHYAGRIDALRGAGGSDGGKPR